MPSTRRRFLTGLGAVGTGVLAGCVTTKKPDTSGTWPRRDLTSAHIGSAAVNGPTKSLYRSWHADLGDGTAHITPTSPVVANNTLYVAYGRHGGITSYDCGAWLDAYDATTGKRTLTTTLWTQTDVASEPISDSVVFDRDALLVQTLGGLIRVSTDGTVRWTLDNATSRGLTSPVPPVVAGGLVVAATYGYSDGGSDVHAVERESGDHRWNRHIGTSVPWALAAANGVLYVPRGVPNSGITALNLSTGKRHWQWDGRVAGPLTVANGTLYLPLRVGATAGAVAALDPKTGDVKWRERVGKQAPAGGFAVADSRIYHAGGGGLEARNADTGALIWRYGGTDSSPQVRHTATPVVAGGTVYITGWIQRKTSYGHVFALDAATGDPHGRVAFGRKASTNGTVPAITNSLGYMATDQGHVVAFESCGTSLFGRCLVN